MFGSLLSTPKPNDIRRRSCQISLPRMMQSYVGGYGAMITRSAPPRVVSIEEGMDESRLESRPNWWSPVGSDDMTEAVTGFADMAATGIPEMMRACGISGAHSPAPTTGAGSLEFGAAGPSPARPRATFSPADGAAVLAVVAYAQSRRRRAHLDPRTRRALAPRRGGRDRPWRARSTAWVCPPTTSR